MFVILCFNSGYAQQKANAPRPHFVQIELNAHPPDYITDMSMRIIKFLASFSGIHYEVVAIVLIIGPAVSFENRIAKHMETSCWQCR